MTRRDYLGVYGLYLLLAVLLTFPLVLNLNRVFIGAPESDAYEYARHMWWFGHALRNGEQVFFHPLLAHPDGLPGAWLWAIPLQSFPAWLLALALPLPVAYNLTVLFRLALNGWAMFYMVRRLPGKPGNEAALVAGAILMLYPAVQGHLFGSHLGLIALWPAPLYLDALLRVRERGGWANSLRVAAFFVLGLLGSNLLLVFVLAPLTLLVLATDALRRRWGALRREVGGVLLGAVGAAVFVVPAVVEQLTVAGAVRPAGVVRFSADALTLFSPSFFAPHALPWSAAVLGTNLVEGYGYMGVIAGLLALVGVWRSRVARPWLMVAALAWLLSLGPVLKVFDQPVTFAVDGRITYIPLPFALLHHLPVIEIIRTPARFNLFIGLAVGVMAAYGVSWLLGHLGLRWRWAVALGLIGLLFADSLIIWSGFPTVPAEIPTEIGALRDDPTVTAVLNLPHDNLLVAKEAMYLQTAHHKPLIGGFVSRETPVSFAKREVLQKTLDPALLAEAEVGAVVLFRGVDADLDQSVYNALGPPEFENDRLALFRVPPPDTPPALTALPGIVTQVYTPLDTWATLSADLTAETRPVHLLLDGERIAAVAPGEPLTASVPLTHGYHTLTLGLVAPCPPTTPHLVLACPPVGASDVALLPDAPFGNVPPVQFAGGPRLRNATVTADGETVRARLWWHFDTPPLAEQVRFVHLVNARGEQVAGSDMPLALERNGAYTETVHLARPEAQDGPFAVYVGWYRFPSLERLPVLGDAPGARNNWVQVGEVGP